VRIREVQAFPLHLQRPGAGQVGTAGLHGERRAAAGARYHRVAPYRALYSDHIESLLVRVRADDGLEGWGESQAPVAPEAVGELVERALAAVVVGQDPREVETLWQDMYDAMRDRGHTTGFWLDAIAGVDQALWDLNGRLRGEPVWRLLDGRNPGPQGLPAYLSGPRGATVDERIEDARRHVKEGFRAVKLFLGRGLNEDLAETRRFRDALGGEVALFVDVQWRYDLADAIRLGRGLEELGVGFLETPLDPEDIAGHAELARTLALPIAVGEAERTRWQFRRLLEAGAADLLQPDVGRCGISEVREIASLAEAHHRAVALHCGVGLGPYVAASVQVGAAIPNLAWIEYQPDMAAAAGAVLEEPVRVADGRFVVPDGPGLGVAVRSPEQWARPR
jgi:L-alanine-DL-glutamate epimerase-like enolase superfamily enzyme